MTDRSVLSKQEGRTCPDALELARLHAKMLTPDAAERLLDHLADCASCTADYKLVAGLHDEDEQADAEMERAIASFSVNSEFGRRALAMKMSRRSRKFRAFYIAAGVATAAIVLAGGWYLQKGRETASLHMMMADVYTRGRTTQFRLASGGDAAALTQQSGSASDNDALLNARVEIERRLKAKADDAALLTALGETSVLRKKLDEASVTLERAYHVSGAPDADAAMDLATTYALRALQLKSDAPLRNKALALLGDYIAARPQSAAAYFNRAVIREMTNDHAGASNDFRQSLKYEQDEGWRQEIRERLKQATEVRQ